MSDNCTCKICNKLFSSDKGLSYHITHAHNISLEEYYLKYEITNQEAVGKCVVCGKPTAFLSRVKGYQLTCSESCGSKYGAISGKQTMLAKYGVKAKNNPDKNKQYYLENPDAKKLAYEHMVETKRKNGSYERISEKIQAKRHTYIKNFEQENDCTMVYTLVRKFGQGWYKAQILSEDDYLVSDYNSWNLHFVKNSSISKIVEYNNFTGLHQVSTGEKAVLDFVKSIYSGTIIENTRKVISPNELDIYLPEKNVAIEFNGTWYHSKQAGTDKKYHFQKSFDCEKLGIRLIHVYEYQWNNSDQREILKSIIKSAIGANTEKIFARKCELRELKQKDVVDFSNKNSLHRHRNASVYLGLFYKDELVEVMTFGHAFFARDKSIDYECIRSITKLNTTVVGGMNKLFSYFIKNYNPNKVLYYVDYNTHIGNSMSKLGFEFESYSKGGMINIAKDADVERDFGYVFNRKPTEHSKIKDLTAEGRILTIYDAGVKRYMWKNNK